MAATSAGILLYRRGAGAIEVLLVHPGGPFWAARDAGAWSIPKGLLGDTEEPYAAALREFAEELGSPAPDGDSAIELGEVRLKSGKRIQAWALEGDLDAAAITSNTFTLEWPPRSGRTIEAPEVDRAEWFGLAEARVRLNPGQVPLVDRLAEALGAEEATSI